MKKEKELCPHCKTGMDSYKLDKHSPVCPFQYFHNGHYCCMFVELDADEKQEK